MNLARRPGRWVHPEHEGLRPKVGFRAPRSSECPVSARRNRPKRWRFGRSEGAPSAYGPRSIPGGTGSRRRGLVYRRRARRSAWAGITRNMLGIPWPPCEDHQCKDQGRHDGGERSAVNPAFRFLRIAHACSPARLVQSRTASPGSRSIDCMVSGSSPPPLLQLVFCKSRRWQR
jgi:hypothetical protein